VSEVIVFDKESGELSTIRRGILRWPSWSWQRRGLIAFILTGFILSLSFSGCGSLVGITFLAIGLYSGIRTGWLSKVDEVSLNARVLCAIAIVCGLIILAIVIIAIAISGIIMCIFFSALSGLARSSRR